MNNNIKDSSEKNFQEKFVRELEKYKWDAPDFLDGNKQKVTVDTLIDNWRNQLNLMNADQLEEVPLTDNEFKQVLAKVNQISNSYEAAKILAIEEAKGKIDGIYRDDNPKVTRKQITLTIFKKADIRGGSSNYQIAREIETSNNNRFDLVLLINGLPLINIELKRTDKTIEEAFNQFKRYYQAGEYTHNFMAFSQMMVITTELETRYFATPKSVKDFNPSFAFHWADKLNHPIISWEKVIKNFLMIPLAHQMVGDYLVIDEAKDEENRHHMLLRPYQVFALQAVENAAIGRDKQGFPHGGFIWHTTGSGKTITSFKTALFLSKRLNFDKIIFLVDRIELDNKTSEQFKAYAKYDAISVDDTIHTYQLKKLFKSNKKGIIVTTTFKLNNLVEDLNQNQAFDLKDKKIVFIIDEAHRTTMGGMMGKIKDFFQKNGLFYGFTGTPLFDENKVIGKINEKSELINTTEKLFGSLLHQYSIDQAIADGNVLGFHIDYMNTKEFNNHDDLREKLVEQILIEKPHKSQKDVEREVYQWSKAKVEEQALEKSLLIYQDETHIPQVVSAILDNWESQSQNCFFNAILTVKYKNRVIAYYKEFQKQLSERKQTLNIAMTFSFGSNENDREKVPLEIIEKMFVDYELFTGIKFIVGNKRSGEKAYYDDLVDRATRGGKQRNSKNIDLVIVADQLLTGYDSKFINTLYVDRKLDLQGLIQAYSRTNRIFGQTKEFGTIINFKTPEITREAVEAALTLYGSGGENSLVIVDIYSTAVEKLKLKIRELQETLPDPTTWIALRDNETEKKIFNQVFRNTAKQLNLVEQYYEFNWNEMLFGISEHTWMQYVGAYKNLNPQDELDGTGVPIIPLNGKAKLASTQIIDAAHILNLIGSKTKTKNGMQIIDDETLRLINEKIQELSSMGEDGKANLLKEFVDTELLLGKIPANINFDEAFENWKKAKIEDELVVFAKEWGLNHSLFSKSFHDFSTTEPNIIPYLEELTTKINYSEALKPFGSNQLQHNIELTVILPKWMKEIKQKYS